MKVKLWVSTNRVGSTAEKVINIPDEDLEDLTEGEKETYIEWDYSII